MRKLGIAAGLLVLVGAAVFAIATVLSLSNETAWTDLERGECFDLGAAVEGGDDDLAELRSVDTVDCDEPHDAEVVAVGELNPDEDRPYPSDEELFAEIDRACATLVSDGIDHDAFGLLPIAPDARTWDDREGRFACVAVALGGGTVTGSALE